MDTEEVLLSIADIAESSLMTRLLDTFRCTQFDIGILKSSIKWIINFRMIVKMGIVKEMLFKRCPVEVLRR